MFQSISPTQKTYEKILEQILELIRDGKLKQGDRLPSERTLCEELEVGRTSLKQAISTLCSMGIVESRQGEGNFIVQNLSVNLKIPFTAQFFLTDCKISDIVQIRYLLEIQIVRIVSQIASEDQLEHLGAIVERMKKLGTNKERVALNSEFHNYLVEICGNELLCNIYTNISSLIDHQVRVADGLDFYENHRKLFNALKARDLATSVQLMREHFEEKYPDLEDNFFRYLR